MCIECIAQCLAQVSTQEMVAVAIIIIIIIIAPILLLRGPRLSDVNIKITQVVNNARI